jgi:putative transposase
MSRPRRCLLGGMVFHVLNRGVNRRTLFHDHQDYGAFLADILESLRTHPMRICSFCVMPNHWHMVLWPRGDGDISSFVHHLASLHALRWKRRHDELGLGPLYQGRFRAFPVQSDQGSFRLDRLGEYASNRSRARVRASMLAARGSIRRRSLGRRHRFMPGAGIDHAQARPAANPKALHCLNSVPGTD